MRRLFCSENIKAGGGKELSYEFWLLLLEKLSIVAHFVTPREEETEAESGVTSFLVEPNPTPAFHEIFANLQFM